MIKLRTEKLLTTPASKGGFDLVTATPAQRAICRIIDAAPLGELADNEDVVELVGGPEAIAALPKQPPAEVVILAGIRSAKTMIASAAALRMALTVDLSKYVKPTDTVRVPLLSLTKEKAQTAYNMLEKVVLRNPFIRMRLVGEPTSNAIVLRNLTTGHPVIMSVAAGRKAGGSLVSDWVAGVIFDEAPRMNGSEDGVINLDDSRQAVIGRMLPGAQIIYPGSPWRAMGPIYDMVEEHHGAPSERCVVFCGRGPVLNPYWWTPERCDEILLADPMAYTTDVLADFGAMDSGLLDPASVKAASRELPLELPPNPALCYSAACDPSEGSATGNAWTLVIVKVDHDAALPAKKRYSVALAREWRGKDPDAILKECAEICHRFGLREAATDRYAAASNQAIARSHGLTLRTPEAGQKNLDDYTDFASLLHTKAIELPPPVNSPGATQGQTLRRDLLSIRKRRTAASYVITLPKTQDGRHADFAPALVAAVMRGKLPLSSSPVGTSGPVSRSDNPRPVTRMPRPV